MTLLLSCTIDNLERTLTGCLCSQRSQKGPSIVERIKSKAAGDKGRWLELSGLYYKDPQRQTTN